MYSPEAVESGQSIGVCLVVALINNPVETSKNAPAHHGAPPRLLHQ